MIEGIIYCYHSPSNKYYIGQTIHENKRKRQHTQLSNTGDNAYFHKAIRKYGMENFKYSVHNTIATYLKRYGGECNYKGYIWRYKK